MNSILDPTPTGGGVLHCTERMLAYHCGAFVGSPAKAATTFGGRSMVVSTSTSTLMTPLFDPCRSPAPSRSEFADPGPRGQAARSRSQLPERRDPDGCPVGGGGDGEWRRVA